MSLAERLKARILEAGPMSVAEFMALALHDPAGGYYARRPAIGAEGDFITAPAVSQMFGELIGLWAAQAWTALGSPARFRLVELGPGTGVLMQDLLRAARHVPGFRDAADLWLVENSPPLRALQAERLAGAGPRFARDLTEVPGGAPLILVANEFFDCLPARQFVLTEAGWCERRVGLDAAGRLAFGLVPAPRGFEPPAGAAPGLVYETSPAQEAMAESIGARIAADGGAALVIDYGRDRPGPGDTLQALKGHRKVEVLESVGEADLTVHVDFPAVAAAAASQGAVPGPILSQAEFLKAMGVEARAAALARARPDQAQTLARQLARLVEPDQMGTLFKVLAIVSPGLAAPGV